MMNILREVVGKGICFFIVLAVVGCTTTSNIHRFRGSGIRDTFKASYFDVFEGAKEIAVMQGMGVKEDNYDQKYLIVGSGVSLMSYGEIVAIYFEPNRDDTETAVEIVSKAKVRTNIFAPDWKQKFLAALHGLVRETP